MESAGAMMLFLEFWLIDLFVAITIARRGVGPLPLFIVPRIPIAYVAITMIGIFIVGGAPTVAQLGADSPGAMQLWSDWYNLWPVFLLVTSVAALVYFVATAVCLCRRDWRKAFWPNFSGLLASSMAYCAVLFNFPDA
jgi:hypothetical protein